MLFTLFSYLREDLMGTVILIANTFGLVTLILLLGFGLVEVPRWVFFFYLDSWYQSIESSKHRNLWRSANRSLSLKHHYYRIAEHHRELEEAKLVRGDGLNTKRTSKSQLTTFLLLLYQTYDRVLRSVKQASEDVPNSDPYRVFINKIIDEVY